MAEPTNSLRPNMGDLEYDNRAKVIWNCPSCGAPENASHSITCKRTIEKINHPQHYGGDTVYEVIKVCEAWGLDSDAYLFNVVKYVGRAGKKGDALEDLKKARFYLERRINKMEERNVR